MNSEEKPNTEGLPPIPAGAASHRAPVTTLLVLSPVIAELVSGSIRLTALPAILPAAGVWGGGALLIREIVRRRGGGWLAMLLLGLALAVAEECIIQQTSVAPLIGIPAEQVYGRAFGVNWEYLLWALGFEAVWAVVVPIQLAEALFPDQRDGLWLRRRGLLVTTLACAGSALFAWFIWTHVFLPRMYPNSVYHVPVTHTLIALLTIVALIAGALLLPRPKAGRSLPPSPLPAGLWSFGFSLLWFLQILLAFGAVPNLPPGLAIAAGCLVALAGFLAFGAWTRAAGWTRAHSLACCGGVVFATVLGGAVVLYVALAGVPDRIFQVLCGSAVLAAMARLGTRARGADKAD